MKPGEPDTKQLPFVVQALLNPDEALFTYVSVQVLHAHLMGESDKVTRLSAQLISSMPTKCWSVGESTTSIFNKAMEEVVKKIKERE